MYPDQNAQTTNHVFLVEPKNFGFNSQTAKTNAFQHHLKIDEKELKTKVFDEFYGLVRSLQSKGIHVTVFPDSENFINPDAVFPNNWISMHHDGTIVLYPMESENRRRERNTNIIRALKRKYLVHKLIDYSCFEAQKLYMEGTGSIVFDHRNKKGYACISPRTDKEIFKAICRELNYTPIDFVASDINGKAIYHTNVMMNIGSMHAVICLDSIQNKDEKECVRTNLKDNGKEIVEISFLQMNQFAGNMLELTNGTGQNFLILSKRAYNSLTEFQIEQLSKHSKLVPVDVDYIEQIGGGSVRCMIAEIFTPPQDNSINP